MRILYYYWYEYNGKDCQNALVDLGHDVSVFSFVIKNYDYDEEFEKSFYSKLDAGYDCVFTFNYFPIISRCCENKGIPYVVWVFDSPHFTLYSKTINNSVNQIFLFDRRLIEELKLNGIDKLHHCPLAVNTKRLEKLCNEIDKDGALQYDHDISFVGNLYDNEYNFYDQIKYLPEMIKEYLDKMIELQTHCFGVDYFSDKKIIPDYLMNEINKYIKFEESENYNYDRNIIIKDMFRKKTTIVDRRRILTLLGEEFKVSFYSTPGTIPIKNVPNLGMVDYMNVMPRVFHNSKVNLNITLRTIISGMSLRTVDILAAGGFLLSDFKEELAENFIDGEDIAFYYSVEELLDKARWYLAHDDERKKIALSGMNKCRYSFDYRRVIPKIFKYI